MADAGGSIERRITTTLENTPTWVVAVVCCIIVIVSFADEQALYYASKVLHKPEQKPLLDALKKIKEEFMLRGFISLLLSVFQNKLEDICISQQLASTWLPCKNTDKSSTTTVVTHLPTNSFPPTTGRRLLAEKPSTDHCGQGKVPLISLEAFDQLHMFIFVLATFHVIASVNAILCFKSKICLWRRWEKSIDQKGESNEHLNLNDPTKSSDTVTCIQRLCNHGNRSFGMGWWCSFFMQLVAPVTKSDYVNLRYNFIRKHRRDLRPGSNFIDYMTCANMVKENDFKEVIAIRWYLWFFVIIFLLLNVAGWHIYLWTSFIPLILLLVVNTKLAHKMGELTREVVKNHQKKARDLADPPTCKHLHKRSLSLLLHLIHIALFQNSFELAFFFFTLFQFGFESCLMGKLGYAIPRVILGVFVQILLCYNTFPLYSILKTQLIFIEDCKCTGGEVTNNGVGEKKMHPVEVPEIEP